MSTTKAAEKAAKKAAKVATKVVTEARSGKGVLSLKGAKIAKIGSLTGGLKLSTMKFILGMIISKPLLLGGALPVSIVSYYGLSFTWSATMSSILYANGRDPSATTTPSLVAGRLASFTAMAGSLPSVMAAKTLPNIARRVAGRGIGASIIGGGVQAAVLLSSSEP